MDTEDDPIGNDTRKERRSRRLPPDAACALCGITDPPVLGSRKARRSLLEGHHGEGEANNDEVIVVLCLNCHATATEAQRDVGALPPGRAPSCIERLSLALRSLGSFFELLATSCYRWAAELAQMVTALDLGLPNWRNLPGMP